MQNLTEEQKKEVEERTQKALEYLKESNLTLEAIVLPVNIGKNVFANQIIPVLQDSKYLPTQTEDTIETKEENK